MYNNKIFYLIFTLALTISITIHAAEAAEPLTLSVSNDIYYAGDYVVVFGQVDTIFENMPVIIRIHHESNLVEVAQVEVANDGTYVKSFNASGGQWVNEGIYQVSAVYSTQTTEKTFEFFGKMADTDSAAYPVNIPNSGTFDIGYTISGGEINNITMDKDRNSLLLDTTVVSNGNLILKLPRESFDSQTGNTEDEIFIILISKGANTPESFEQVQYEEVGTSSEYRTIRIPLEEGDRFIEVVGTYVIPEFGSIVMMILLAATASAIIVSKSKFSIKYN